MLTVFHPPGECETEESSTAAVAGPTGYDNTNPTLPPSQSPSNPGGQATSDQAAVRTDPLPPDNDPL